MLITLRSYDQGRPTGSVARATVLKEPDWAIFAVNDHTHRSYSFDEKTGRELQPCVNSEWRIDPEDLRRIQEAREERREAARPKGPHRW